MEDTGWIKVTIGYRDFVIKAKYLENLVYAFADECYELDSTYSANNEPVYKLKSLRTESVVTFSPMAKGRVETLKLTLDND